MIEDLRKFGDKVMDVVGKGLGWEHQRRRAQEKEIAAIKREVDEAREARKTKATDASEPARLNDQGSSG